MFFLAAFGFTLLASLALTAAAVRYFPRLGLLDNPRKYGLTRAPIPYFGGVAVFLAFLLGVLFFAPLTREVVALLAGATLLAAVAFWDDARGLPPLPRLLAQMTAAGLLIAGGVGVTHFSSPFGGVWNLAAIDWSVPLFGEHHLHLLADLFTVFWVVLFVNALNWFDGVPALSSGVATVAALTLLGLSLRPDYHFFDQTATATVAAVLAGAAAGFTVFNFPPPRILLGDTGSMLFGFVLAALAVFSGGKVATAALVLGLPLLDAVFVILRRILSGRSPLAGDLSHLHHRLLAAGLSPRGVLGVIYLACGLFGAAALWLPNAAWKAAVFALLSAALFAVSARLPARLAREK